jgi:hypothetical protein
MRTLAFAMATLFVVSVFVVSSAMAQTPRLDAEGYDMDKPAPPGTLGEGQVRSDPTATGEMSSWGPHQPVRFLDVAEFQNRWSSFAVAGRPSPSPVETTGQR